MLLLYSLQSPVNIGQILRTGEQFHIPVAVYDPMQVFDNAASIATISDFSCGALTRTPPEIITDFDAYRKLSSKRFIATCLNKKAAVLPDFSFSYNDVILLGNEYDGLPQRVIDACDDMVYIPLPNAVLPKPRSLSPIDPVRSAAVSQNGLPNLGVAATAGIISYHLGQALRPCY